MNCDVLDEIAEILAVAIKRVLDSETKESNNCKYVKQMSKDHVKQNN
jgi:hypothetical protein